MDPNNSQSSPNETSNPVDGNLTTETNIYLTSQQINAITDIAQDSVYAASSQASDISSNMTTNKHHIFNAVNQSGATVSSSFSKSQVETKNNSQTQPIATDNAKMVYTITDQADENNVNIFSGLQHADISSAPSNGNAIYAEIQTSNTSDLADNQNHSSVYTGLQQGSIPSSVAGNAAMYAEIQTSNAGGGVYTPVVAEVIQVTSNDQDQTPVFLASVVKSTNDMIQIETVSESNQGQGQMMSCLVCGDKGSGYHYSVFSCEGCKGFFKRTVQKNLMYHCKDQQNCSINKFTRNSCQACRFQKCQEMGMKREAVREDRSPGGKHRSKRPRLSTDDVSGYSTGARGEGEFIQDDETVGEYSDKLVEGLIEAKPDLIPRFDGNTGLQSLGINEMMQFGYAELKFIIDWAKKVPGFSDFCIEDQMALLKSSFMELNVLRLSYRSMIFEDSIKFAEGFVVPVEVAKGLGWGKDLVSATLEFSQRLRDIDIDLVEFSILNGIVLTYPDASGVKDKYSIVCLQNKMLDSLRQYMLRTYPEDQRRYGKMLLRLPSLRNVSAKAAERFLSLTLDGSIQLNDLVLEMIN